MSRKKLHVSAVTPMRDLPNDPSYFTKSNAPTKSTKNIRTPRQGSRRKGKQSQEETPLVRSYLIWFWKIWALGCLSHFASSSFLWGFPSLVDLGFFFLCCREQVGETTSWKLPRRKKSKPNFMFCFEMDQCSSPCLVTKENIEWYVETFCNHP